MRKVITVIQVLLILVFLGCAAVVGKYFYDAHKAEHGFDELKAQTRVYGGEDATGEYVEAERAENGMFMMYYGLYEKNSDFAGWIEIPDTAVDYPVVQAKDNEFYLHRDFDKNYQFAGIPFIDSDSVSGSLNKIIYAHNMKNGSMFAALSKYEKKDFYAQHKIIKFNTLYDASEYEIFSVFRTKVGTKNEFRYHDYANIEDEEQCRKYADKVKALSLYDTGATAPEGAELLTLSTCAYHTSNERYVVVAYKKEFD